jgi:hypothetical protein
LLDEQTTFLIAAVTNLTQAVNMIGGGSNMSFQAKADLNNLLSEAMKNINHAATASPDPTKS